MDASKKTKGLIIAGALAMGTVLSLGKVISPAPAAATGLQISQMKPSGGGVSVSDDISQVIKNAITLVIIFGALLALYFLIMGAIGWITSDGDKGKVETARNRMLYAVVGLLVLASVWAIFQLVLTIAFGTTGISSVSLNSSSSS